MSESRWNAEDIVDGGPLGGGPEKLVERIETAIAEVQADESQAETAFECGVVEGRAEGVVIGESAAKAAMDRLRLGRMKLMEHAFDYGKSDGITQGANEELEDVAKYLDGVDFRKEFPGELCEDVGRMLAAKIREGAHRDWAE